VRSALIAALLAALATPAPAESVILDLPSDMTCEWIIAHENTTPDAMMMASTTYFHGQYMGKPCVKVDYMKAYDLAKRSGSDFAVRTITKLILKRAENGNNKAQKAAKALGLK
jgi:hypothetical protein